MSATITVCHICEKDFMYSWQDIHNNSVGTMFSYDEKTGEEIEQVVCQNCWEQMLDMEKRQKHGASNNSSIQR